MCVFNFKFGRAYNLALSKTKEIIWKPTIYRNALKIKNYKEQYDSPKTYLLIQNIRKFFTNPPSCTSTHFFSTLKCTMVGRRSVVVVERYSTPPFRSRDSIDQSRTVIWMFHPIQGTNIVFGIILIGFIFNT